MARHLQNTSLALGGTCIDTLVQADELDSQGVELL
jgi:hypothetical protein